MAAMAVVFQHSMELVWPAWARFSLSWFRVGEFGVVVFFLCSGFIIPASLERHGSQGRFWIGRFFRLYPLYWAVLAAALLVHAGFGRYPLDAQFLHHPFAFTAANATLMQDFVGGHLVLGQSWSLAYELTFYAMVSALFVVGWHRRSVPFALAGFVAAAVVLNDRVPPASVIHFGAKQLAVLVVATGCAACTVAWLARGAGRVRWLAVAITVVVIPVVVNRPEDFKTMCYFLATMFAGTVLYRWTTGQVTAPVAGGVVAAALVAIVAMNVTSSFSNPPGINQMRAEIITNLAAYAIFVVALLARRVRFPKWILFLGLISYSLYLDHSLVIYSLGWFAHNKWVTSGVWIAGSVVLSAVTYRVIEKPAMDLGHRLGARWVARQTEATEAADDRDGPRPSDPAPVPAA